MTDEAQEWQDRILADPRRVASFLSLAYNLASAVQRAGDWDADYYRQANAVYEEIGSFLYPDQIDVVEKPRELPS